MSGHREVDVEAYEKPEKFGDRRVVDLGERVVEQEQPRRGRRLPA
jgi:hypothetical protein